MTFEVIQSLRIVKSTIIVIIDKMAGKCMP